MLAKVGSIAIGVALTFQAAWSLAAFPGAEGFGAETRGGSGGRVMYVNTLEDSGDGSLRAACEAKGPRTVVFRLGGRIRLRSELSITEPFLTIAGQSAPGDGICVSDRRMVVRTNDVIIRFIRFRPGDVSKSETDAFTVHGGKRVMVDHCSFSWSTDELLSVVGESDAVTVQWCVLSEALDRSYHGKGRHSFGSLLRPSMDSRVSFHHNFFMSSRNRNPRVGSYGGRRLTLLFINNFIYNCAKAGIGGGDGELSRIHYAGNFIAKGPDTRVDKAGLAFSGDTEGMSLSQQDNIVNGCNCGWTMFGGRYSRATEPLPETPGIGIRRESAEEAARRIADRAGATIPRRDAVDIRLFTEFHSGKGRIIDSQVQVGGWPEYSQGMALLDSDGDGMPDDWERRNGLDPADADDGSHHQTAADGYTNLETYLNDLVGEP